MSALGQKQTYAVQKAMSALPPITTAKADMCGAARDARFGPIADSCIAAAKARYSIISSARALQCRRHVEAKRLGKLPTHHRIIACADERRSETLSGVQGSGEMYSVAIASRFSAAARTKTIVNSVAHMVDAPRFPGTDLEAACQL